MFELSRLIYWQHDRKHCSFSLLRFNLNFSSVSFDDVITQTQSQSGSVACWFGSEERLKNLIQYFLRNAISIVFDSDLQPSICPFGADNDRWLVILGRHSPGDGAA